MSRNQIKESGIAKTLARKELIDMVPYQSARRLQKADKAQGDHVEQRSIWLNANEASGDGRYELNADCINRYPDFQPDHLIDAYSDYANVPAEQILATRGADEGIELLIRTFCTSYQDSIMICPPTYGMYAISAENHAVDVIKVPLIENKLDIDSVLNQASRAKVIFLCSPGNPTGNLLPSEQIQTVLDNVKESIVVLDEAYIEFSAEHSVATWLDKYPQLVVLRTLSKAFALAGLRCGFTLASSDIIEMLSKVIAPYPISAPVADIASQALSENGLLVMKNRVTQITAQRTQFSQWLASQSWCQEVFPSAANFILFRTSKSELIFNYLKQQGILIRDQSKQLQLANCLRISIGSEEEMNAVKTNIERVMATNAELEKSEQQNNNNNRKQEA